MSFASLLMIGLALQSQDTDPLDGFMTNFRNLQTSIEFTYRVGKVPSSQVSPKSVWDVKEISFSEEDSRLSVHGRWECDGYAEFYRNRPPDEMREEIVKDEIFNFPIEMMFDDRLVVRREPGKHYLDVTPAAANPWHLLFLKGPFHWWNEKFPDCIAAKWSDAEVSRRPGVHGGYATLDVILARSKFDTDYALTIAYDPAIGYLPRYFTQWGLLPDGRAVVFQLFLREAGRCLSGSFVPLDWLRTSFPIPDFRNRYPGFDPQQELECPEPEVHVDHFRVVSFDESKPNIQMRSNVGFDRLNTAGRIVPLPERPLALSMADVHRLAGLSAYQTRPPHPGIDLAELALKPKRNWKNWVAGVGLIVLGAIVLWLGVRRRWVLHAMLLAAILVFAGCSSEPMPRLETETDRETYVADWQDASPIVMELTVRNTGNSVLNIQDFDPGCACSAADRSFLPVRIEPGEEICTRVHLEKRANQGPQRLTWTFTTDRGTLICGNVVRVFARASITPFRSMFPVLYVDQPWDFPVTVHRIDVADSWVDATLVGPPQLSINQTERKTADGPTPGYRIEQTTYTVSVQDLTTLGEHRAEMLLKTPRDETLASAFVHWSRQREVSVVPPTLYLAHKKARAFLRSRDDDVEFVRVVESPPGIEAIVVSPKEISVRPKEEAPNDVRGDVVVETDAATEPIVRIPVIRLVSSATVSPAER